MNEISINAYAKINLCLDVRGKLPGGYHEVAMVMQQIGLHDVIDIRWMPGEESLKDKGCLSENISIRLKCDDPRIPHDETNLAYKAAEVMREGYAGSRRGVIEIEIQKNIPMAAGLAGGSSDCGAVIHGINRLWDLGLTVDELCTEGAKLGSDVPFCIMGQAAADPALKEVFREDPNATHCAIATGRGTDLEPIPGLESYLVLSKPPISVSTGEVYRGIDEAEIREVPDIPEMVRGLREKNMEIIEKNMINVLENYTLRMYPIVVYTKNKIQDEYNSKPLMSGSGPTVFCLCKGEEEAVRICEGMTGINEESYWTQTTF